MRFSTTVELGGHTCRSTVADGNTVEVDVEVDTAPRTVGKVVAALQAP